MSPRAAGDMDGPEFRAEGTRIVDWTVDYLGNVGQHPVRSAMCPGQVRSSLSAAAPEVCRSAGFWRSSNQELLRRVNASGQVFLSSTRLHGCFALRMAIGHVRTADVHLARAWDSIRASLQELQHRPTLADPS